MITNTKKNIFKKMAFSGNKKHKKSIMGVENKNFVKSVKNNSQ